MRIKRITYTVLNASALIGIMLFPLYLNIVKAWPGFFFCFLKRYTHLYCPMCGGTRAAYSLAKLDLISALRYNAFAVVLIILLILFDIRCFIRLFITKNEGPLIRLWEGIAVLALMIAFFITRNVLLVFWNIDQIGDLLKYWL